MKESLQQLIRSINPLAYPKLATASVREVIGQLKMLLFWSFLATLIVVSVVSWKGSLDVASQWNNIETVAPWNWSVKEPLSINAAQGALSNPQENLTAWKWVLSRKGISSVHPVCMVARPLCPFFANTIETDFPTTKDAWRERIPLLLVLLLPSLVFWTWVVLLSQVAIIMAILSVFIFFLFWLLKEKVTIGAVIKLACFAAMPYALILIVNLVTQINDYGLWILVPFFYLFVGSLRAERQRDKKHA
ncbi:hypothetical protein HZB02_05655 [Candidatus Woesearchaeota archaeon]|nr:hypothetical protein [Candidatus Woesearchaeota archaeon]